MKQWLERAVVVRYLKKTKSAKLDAGSHRNLADWCDYAPAHRNLWVAAYGVNVYQYGKKNRKLGQACQDHYGKLIIDFPEADFRLLEE